MDMVMGWRGLELGRWWSWDLFGLGWEWINKIDRYPVFFVGLYLNSKNIIPKDCLLHLIMFPPGYSKI